MNKYLTKISEVTDLPLRQRSEVIINKNGKMLLTVNKTKDGYKWFGIPGGGIEEGQDPLSAAKQEALEEVGISLGNMKHTGVTHILDAGYSSPTPGKEHRNQQYRGSINHVVVGDYLGKDTSLLGADNDAAKYKWVPHKEAHDYFLKERDGEYAYRSKALNKYLTKISSLISSIPKLGNLANRSTISGGFKQSETTLKKGLGNSLVPKDSPLSFSGNDKFKSIGKLDNRTSQVTKAIDKPGISKI